MKKKLLIIIFLFLALFFISCNDKKYNEESFPPTPNNPTENVPPKENHEESIIETLTLTEKVGQLVIVGFPQNVSEDYLREYIDKYKVGGFILFNRNHNNFEELYTLNQNLKKWNEGNPIPLFISIDEEGGIVSRIPKEGTKIPNASSFGKADNIELTKKSGIIVGRQLYAAGINLNFAPVLDILTKEDNELMKLRSYGDNANIVSKHGISFINGLKSQGIIATAKHFPGHGHTNTDSHSKLPIVDIDMDTLENRELIPFKDAIDSEIDAIMVGHLSFPKIDNTKKPATKSSIFLKDILRDQLGFNGLVLTDDIEMEGFLMDNPNLEESIIQAFNSGVDVFIIGHTKEIQEKVMKALYYGVENGLIPENRLNQSLKRIICIKEKYKIYDKMNLNYEDAYDLFTKKDDIEFLKDI